MPRFIVIDPGSTPRQVRRLFVVDAGGTSRLIRRAFVIDASGVARQFFSGEPTIFLDDTYAVDDSTILPSPASASLRLQSNGVIDAVISSGTSVLGNWIDDSSQAGNYEARVSLISGTLSTGIAGSWLSLSGNRSWGVSRGPSGVKSCTFTLEIRKTSTGAVLDSSTVTVTAAVDA